MFAPQQKVNIRSTEELPTSHNGQVGWIEKRWKAHPEFYTVTTFSGDSVVFHETQLVAHEDSQENSRPSPPQLV